MTQGYRVLIADDEEMMLRTMAMVLRSAGYKVDTVQNGIEVMEAITHSKERYDLLVTDIQMPGMSGDELLDELRQRSIDIPVLVITGFGTKGLVVELMRKGCADYIDKPFTGSAFLERVDEVIEKESRRRKAEELHADADRDYKALVNREIERHRDELRALRSQVEAAVEAYGNLLAVHAGDYAIPICWRNRPLADLGGDFLGLRAGKGSCNLIVADVAGHDMGASYHSVLIKTLFEDNCVDGRDGEALFQILNRVLIETRTERMVTALHVRYMEDERLVEVVSAAHPSLLHLPADGSPLRVVHAEGTVLGILEDVTHPTQRFHVEVGDRLVLYTDGLAAMCRIDGPTGRRARLSSDGIVRMVEAHRSKDLDTMVGAVWDEAMSFGRNRLEDDTMLVAVEIPEARDVQRR